MLILRYKGLRKPKRLCRDCGRQIVRGRAPRCPECVQLHSKPPRAHVPCAVHPDRFVSSLIFRGKEPRCYRCEQVEAELQRLDLLIRIGLGDQRQDKITPEMVRAALMRSRAIETTVAAEILNWPSS